MTSGYSDNLRREMITIGPGEHHATRDDHVISTILGSCVAVALYDQTRGVGGLNHFMLPEANTGRHVTETKSGRYGMFAMELLFGDLIKLGSTREHLRAKVFGGGTTLGTASNGKGVADQNVRFAFDYLRSEGIPIDSSDVGGKTARRVLFLPASSKVLLKKTAWVENRIDRVEKQYARRLKETSDDGGQLTIF